MHDWYFCKSFVVPKLCHLKHDTHLYHSPILGFISVEIRNAGLQIGRSLRFFFFKTPAWQLIFLHPSNSDIRENCLSYKLEKRSSRALVGDDIWPFYTVFLSVTGSWQLFARQQTFMTTMTSFKRHFRPSSHRVNHDKKQVLKKPAWHWGGL